MVVAGARWLGLGAGIGLGFVVGTGAALCWLIRRRISSIALVSWLDGLSVFLWLFGWVIFIGALSMCLALSLLAGWRTRLSPRIPRDSRIHMFIEYPRLLRLCVWIVHSKNDSSSNLVCVTC